MHQPLAALLALYVALALPLCAAESENVQLLYVGPAETSTAKGALQGLKEANVLGRFTGHGYQLTQVDNSEKLGNAVTNLQPAAVLAALDSCKLLAVSALFADAGVAVFNLAAGDDTLRQTMPAQLAARRAQRPHAFRCCRPVAQAVGLSPMSKLLPGTRISGNSPVAN